MYITLAHLFLTTCTYCVYIHTYIQTYKQTYKQTYIQTYIHTYTHTLSQKSDSALHEHSPSPRHVGVAPAHTRSANHQGSGVFQMQQNSVSPGDGRRHDAIPNLAHVCVFGAKHARCRGGLQAAASGRMSALVCMCVRDFLFVACFLLISSIAVCARRKAGS